jgi:hypothetical protein
MRPAKHSKRSRDSETISKPRPPHSAGALDSVVCLAARSRRLPSRLRVRRLVVLYQCVLCRKTAPHAWHLNSVLMREPSCLSHKLVSAPSKTPKLRGGPEGTYSLRGVGPSPKAPRVRAVAGFEPACHVRLDAACGIYPPLDRLRGQTSPVRSLVQHGAIKRRLPRSCEH